MNPEDNNIADTDNMQMTFMKISHLYFKKVFQQLADTGVHPGQIPMIKLLGASGGLSQHEISEKLQIKPPTVNVSIKRMERAGLVERRPDGQNRRIMRVYITETGENFYKKMITLEKENEKVLFQGFTESEICLMNRFFNQIIKNLEAIPFDKEESSTSIVIAKDKI